MNLLLIRHGQTNWNAMKKIQGTEDIPLNDTGRNQAKTCAESLSAFHWDAIFTSPLLRAKETAQILSSHTNQPPIFTEPLLVERNFGKASGMTWEELRTNWPLYPSQTPDGMEEFPLLCERMEQAVLNCISKSCGDNLILVSHGGAINALLHKISSGTVGTGITFLKNTCVNVLTFDTEKQCFFIKSCNLSAEEYKRQYLSQNF